MIIGTNFKLSSRKFLDDRQYCKSYNELVENKNNILYPPGFEVYCEDEKKYYQYISDIDGNFSWQERVSASNGEGGSGASIDDTKISNTTTWSSAYITQEIMELENLISNAEDYVDEIEERMTFIEGKFQWFEYFDGSYESLKDKPIIPTKVSELENDSLFIDETRLGETVENINTSLDGKIDKEIDMSLIPISELERLKELGNYNDTDIKQRLTEVENKTHIHMNEEILQLITEERINQWDSNSGGIDDYNYLLNKPITKVGDDSSIFLSASSVIDDGLYLVTAKIGEYELYNELVDVYHTDDNNATMVLFGLLKKLTLTRQDTNIFEIVKEVNYEIDKENAEIGKSLTVGELLNIGEGNIANENNQLVQGKFNEEDTEGKYINIVGNGENEDNRKNIHTLDWEGNGWYGGKLSQEGVPTEDKDLVTKGYVDGKFATTENVDNQINTINTRMDNMDKENAKRDVIIETLANGRRRTVESNGNDVDLLFSTERDTVWIDKIEGRTLVNVCDQKEPVVITKSYTVENESHIPLQGEYDGKARPVVYGNTLVNHNIEYNESLIVGKEVNRQGTEILNIEGTKESKVSVKLEGHTAINLATKKGGELCRTFPNASGNKIDLTTDKNSRTDVAIQGNTMVNLHPSYLPWLATNTGSSNFSVTTRQNYIRITGVDDSLEWKFIYCGVPQLDMLKPSTTYTIVCTKLKGIRGFHFCATTNQHYIGAVDVDVNNNPLVCTFTTTDTIEINGQVAYILIPDSGNVDIEIENLMIFEGDLTQTPELIPTEYVEGIQSTFEDKLIPYSIYDGSQLTALTETQYQLPLSVKANTQYTIVTTVNTTKYQYAVYSSDNLNEYFSYNDTVSSATFTSGVNNILFKVRMNPSYGGEDYSFVLSEVQDKFLIVEGDWSGRLDLLTEEYFGKYKVDMSSCGKNLIDMNNPNVHLVKGKIYTIWFTLDTNSNTGVYLKITNKDGSLYTDGFNYHESPNEFINRPEFANDRGNYEIYGGVIFSVNKSCYITKITNSHIISIQLEEGSTATEYEPYYGSTKTVYLNSPLYKGDELVMKDGKLCHYHKMGSITLNGSEDWFANDSLENTIRFSVNLPINSKGTTNADDFIGGYSTSDKFICDNLSTYGRDIECYQLGNNEIGRIYIRVNKSKLSTTDVNGFKQWLSENPTTVVYELAEPWYEPIGAYGKVVLDGSEDENWSKVNQSGTITIQFATTKYPYVQRSDSYKAYCDKFINDYNTSANNDTEHFYTENTTGKNGTIQIIINRSKLLTQDIDGFKQWLKQNPITIIHELVNPQYIDEDMIFDIATTSTLEYQSAVPMANTTFKQYIDELNILESSTQYRVIFDCDVEGLPLEVSLGGTSQVIDSQLTNNISFVTPSLQTNGKLIINGSGMANIDNVRITKGEMVYPYFEGLKSSFEENRINLINSNIALLSSVTDSNRDDSYVEGETYPNLYIPGVTRIRSNLIKVQPNTVYTAICYGFNVTVHEFNKNNIGLKDHLWTNKEVYTFTTSSECEGVVIYVKNDTYGDLTNYVDEFKPILLKGNYSSLTYEGVVSSAEKYRAKIKLSSNDFYFGKGGRI